MTEVLGQRVRMRKLRGLAVREMFSYNSLESSGPAGDVFFTAVSTSYHYEKVSIHSSGSVQLEDGRDIGFSLDLNMERNRLLPRAWPGVRRAWY